MNLNSFRLKIALLSGLITGLLLMASGFGLWRISYQFNLDQLDRRCAISGRPIWTACRAANIGHAWSRR